MTFEGFYALAVGVLALCGLLLFKADNQRWHARRRQLDRAAKHL